MSAVNPGADFDKTYIMAYGTDPDPYGAIPPYKLPYNTYNPNYPAIPGINNCWVGRLRSTKPLTWLRTAAERGARSEDGSDCRTTLMTQNFPLEFVFL